MAGTCDVSVVIAAYNAEELIGSALGSVAGQTVQPREIIVVDDGSSDGTSDAVRAFDPSIVLLRQANAGPGVARNSGVGRARSGWVAFLDADDEWPSNKLELAAGLMNDPGLPGLAVLHGAVRHAWPDGRLWSEHRAMHSRYVDFLQELRWHNAVFGGCSGPVVRRDCFERVGGFDPSLRAAEDWDLWVRIAFRWRLLYVDEVFVNRRELETSLSRNLEMMLACELRVFAKHQAAFRRQGMSLLDARRARAAIWARSGVSWFCSGMNRKARGALARSLVQWPFNMKALVPAAKMVLGLRHQARA